MAEEAKEGDAVTGGRGPCPCQLLADFRSVFIFSEDNSGAALVL